HPLLRPVEALASAPGGHGTFREPSFGTDAVLEVPDFAPPQERLASCKEEEGEGGGRKGQDEEEDGREDEAALVGAQGMLSAHGRSAGPLGTGPGSGGAFPSPETSQSKLRGDSPGIGPVVTIRMRTPSS